MARLRDIPHVVKTVGVWTFLKRVYTQTYEDNLLVWAAALAYSWLFAMFPFIIFCLSMVPFMPDTLKPSEQTLLNTLDEFLVTGENLAEATEDLREEITSPEDETADPSANPPDGVPATLPAEGAATRPATQPGVVAPPPIDPLDDPVEPAPPLTPSDQIEPPDPPVAEVEPPERRPASISQTLSALVSDLINRPPAGILTLSLVVALFTASGGMAMTMAGLDKCYDVAPEKMRPLWKARPMAILLTIVIAFLIMLSLALIPIGGAVFGFVSELELGGIELDWVAEATRLFRWVLGLLILFAALAIAYRFGPSIRTRLHLFSPGSLFAVAMWILTAWGFRVYIDLFGAADNYARTYGSVAGVAILMLVFYLDGLFLLIGAEINAELDFIRLGIRSGDLPEEREVAPIPTYQLDEEDRELKAELEERRSIDTEKPSIDKLESEAPAPGTTDSV